VSLSTGFPVTTILTTRPSVRVAIRDKAHPFVSVHPTPESVKAVLEAASAESGDTKGKSRETSQNPGAVLHHALRWAVERSDLELINWICSLEEEWVSLRWLARRGEF
jgi:hypothetical protein